MRAPPCLLLLALAACAPQATGSQVTFTIDDDAETFVDADDDGIVVSCGTDPEDAGIEMSRGLFEEEEGPLFRVEVGFGRTDPPPDEGVAFTVGQLDALRVGYHGATWPTDVGTVTVTDWVALDDAIIRMTVALAGIGDGDGVSLDGTITCAR